MDDFREVVKKEWDKEVYEEYKNAKNLNRKYGGRDGIRYYLSYEDAQPDIIFGNTFKPCIYDDESAKLNLDRYCPMKMDKVKYKPTPKSFHTHLKDNIKLIRHAADSHCAGIEENMMTRCYCKTKDGKYFIGQHLIGNCPWKEPK